MDEKNLNHECVQIRTSGTAAFNFFSSTEIVLVGATPTKHHPQGGSNSTTLMRSYNSADCMEPNKAGCRCVVLPIFIDAGDAVSIMSAAHEGRLCDLGALGHAWAVLGKS